MPTLPVSRRFVFAATLIVTPLVWTPAVHAQESTSSAPPAHVADVSGAATIEREGSIEPASVNAPVIAGDRIHTATGRMELLFPDGTALDLDENSTLDIQSLALVRLIAGRALLTVVGAGDPRSAVSYRIDTPVASVRTDGPGEYRVAVLAARDAIETELAVARGLADLTTERGTVALRAGERSVAFENGAPSFPQTFNSARFDAFDRWTADRRNARATGRSAEYLPPDLRMYGGTLDRYGSWQYAAPYGYVWYPSVAASWRPYYYGNWSPVRSYGWTWVGLDIWSWPTHHYGRWGHARGSWFWIPGRTWAPAWVSWAGAPDYVSWCPLGFDGRPVFALSIGVGNPWAGWVVVPRRSFGYRDYDVHRYAIAAHQLPRSTPFILQARAPVPVPRVPGRRSVDSRQPTVDPRRSADRPQLSLDNRSAVADRRQSNVTAGRPSGSDQEAVVRRSGPVDPASSRVFRQPLPDRWREPAADRGRAAAPSEQPARPNAVPRAPAGDPRTTTTRPRAPELAAPRYRSPAPDPQTPSTAPPSGSVHRAGPVDRSPSVMPDSRAVTAVPRSAPQRPAGERRVESSERSAPGHAEAHRERAESRRR